MRDAFKNTAEAAYNIYTIKGAPVGALKKGVIDNTVGYGGQRYTNTEKYFKDYKGSYKGEGGYKGDYHFRCDQAAANASSSGMYGWIEQI